MPVDYAGKVRTRDPESSWDAAALQGETKVSRVKAAILDVFTMSGSMTDEELNDRFGAYVWLHPEVPSASPQSVRSRRHELLLQGLVVDTGRHGVTRLGNKAAIWSRANEKDLINAGATAPRSKSETPNR